MLYLASQSPRRRQLLELIGLKFEVLDLDVPEVPAAGETPVDYVSRVAREKAAAGLRKMSGVADAVILAADTEVVLDNEIFGKPRDADDARAMLRRLSGRTHRVLSGVCCMSHAREQQVMHVSEVTFLELTEPVISAYLASGEYHGKAGAYAIQGRAAAFISLLHGSHFSVMGLPLCETAQILADFGIRPVSAIF